MDTYPLTFDEALKIGIKNDARVQNGAQVLDVCTGLRPTRWGLKGYINITQPFTDNYLTSTLGGALGWPFPQLFRGAKVTLLCFVNTIFLVDETDWTATELLLYDAADFGNTTPGAGSITSAGPWHFMDFHDTWVLMNGTTTIFKTGYYFLPIATDEVTIKTGCDIKGRAVMGGFDPSNFYALADWPAYWLTLDDNAPAEIRARALEMANGAGTNWAWWSTIGGGDLLWLISKDLYLSDERPLLEYITNGTFTGGSTSWGFAGSGWSYDTGNNRLISAAGTGTALQSAVNMRAPVVAGNSYAVTYTVSNISGGSVTVSLGAATGTTRSTNGTFTETLVAAANSANLIFTSASFAGNIDTVSMVLVPTDAYAGTMTPWREIMQRNEFGLAPMPWQGTVLHQRRLGDVVMCYGDGGMSALVPFSSPVATFGVRDPQNIGRTVGIASRSAVGGNIDGHVFVDASGEVWRMGANLQAERLGYGHIFSEFLDNDIIVSHDPQRNEFYIAGSPDSAACYVLTETGLGKAPWAPTQVSFAQGGLVSILLGDTSPDVQVETNKFGARRRKHIDQILTVTLTTVDTDPTGWSVIVEYRFRKSKSFLQSASVACDARGVARMNISGLEFRVLLTHPDRTKADLDAVEIEMAHGGRRSLNLLTT